MSLSGNCQTVFYWSQYLQTEREQSQISCQSDSRWCSYNKGGVVIAK